MAKGKWQSGAQDGPGLLTTVIIVVVGVLVAVFLFRVTLLFAIPLLIWGIAGWLAGKIVQQDFGVGESIGLGLAGGLVSYFVFRILDVEALINSGLLGDIIAGVIGALILIVARNFLNRD